MIFIDMFIHILEDIRNAFHPFPYVHTTYAVGYKVRLEETDDIRGEIE